MGDGVVEGLSFKNAANGEGSLADARDAGSCVEAGSRVAVASVSLATCRRDAGREFGTPAAASGRSAGVVGVAGDAGGAVVAFGWEASRVLSGASSP